MTYKIPCQKKSAPCKIFFKYLSKTIGQDLLVYVSSEEPVPNDKRYDMRASLPACMTVLEKNKKS